MCAPRGVFATACPVACPVASAAASAAALTAAMAEAMAALAAEPPDGSVGGGVGGGDGRGGSRAGQNGSEGDAGQWRAARGCLAASAGHGGDGRPSTGGKRQTALMASTANGGATRYRGNLRLAEDMAATGGRARAANGRRR